MDTRSNRTTRNGMPFVAKLHLAPQVPSVAGAFHRDLRWLAEGSRPQFLNQPSQISSTRVSRSAVAALNRTLPDQ